MKKYFKTIFLALFLISLFLIPAFSADNPDNAVLNDPTIDNTAIEDQSKTTANLNKSDESASSLAEQTQNPVAMLISLPFQNNFNFNAQPGNRTWYNLNIQPVIPGNYNKDWNLINRFIIPLQSLPVGNTKRINGIGDLTYEAFFSPNKDSEVIWGAGPVLSLPIGSDALLTNGKYCLGAAGVICKTKFPWVTGLMVQNMWSVYGDPSKKYVNQLLSYPFVNYNFKDGSFISFVPTITADWTSNVNNRWVLPLGLGVGKVTNIGKQPVSLSLSAYKNVMKPDNYPDWQFRFTFSLLFPD